MLSITLIINSSKVLNIFIQIGLTSIFQRKNNHYPIMINRFKIY